MIAIKLTSQHIDTVAEYYMKQIINKLNLYNIHDNIQKNIQKKAYKELPQLVKETLDKHSEYIVNTKLKVDIEHIINTGFPGLDIEGYKSYEDYKKRTLIKIKQEEDNTSKYSTTLHFLLDKEEYNKALTLKNILLKYNCVDEALPVTNNEKINELTWFIINEYQYNAYPFNANYKAKEFFHYLNIEDINTIAEYIKKLIYINNIKYKIILLLNDNKNIIRSSAELKLFFPDAYEYWYNIYKNEIPIETKVYNDNNIPNEIIQIKKDIQNILS